MDDAEAEENTGGGDDRARLESRRRRSQKPRRGRQTGVTNRIAGFIRAISNCDPDLYSEDDRKVRTQTLFFNMMTYLFICSYCAADGEFLSKLIFFSA